METISIDTNTILQLGIGASVAYIVLRLVLDFLTPLLQKFAGVKESSPKGTFALCEEVSRQLAEARAEMSSVKSQIKDLYVWHNVRNQDGIPIWYVPSSLEKAIEALAENVKNQTSVLQSLANFQQDTCKAMERMERRLNGQ